MDMFILTFVTFVYNRRFMISVKHKSRSLRFTEYLVVVKILNLPLQESTRFTMLEAVVDFLSPVLGK